MESMLNPGIFILLIVVIVFIAGIHVLKNTDPIDDE